MITARVIYRLNVKSNWNNFFLVPLLPPSRGVLLSLLFSLLLFLPLLLLLCCFNLCLNISVSISVRVFLFQSLSIFICFNLCPCFSVSIFIYIYLIQSLPEVFHPIPSTFSSFSLPAFEFIKLAGCDYVETCETACNWGF